MLDILEVRYTEEETKAKRAQVAELFTAKSNHVKNSDITAICNHDLELLFACYDQVFFANWFKECFAGTLQFSFSRRMTKSAGKTYYPKDADPARPESLVIKVKINIDMILAYGLVENSDRVGGITTRSRLEALQVVLEHELVHVIEFIHFQQSSCSKKRFRALANHLFGHTESFHCLPTSQQIARHKLGLTLGERVAFPMKGQVVEGLLYAVHKRAVVMVPDRQGDYADQRGQRYTKYYVPLSLLRKSF